MGQHTTPSFSFKIKRNIDIYPPGNCLTNPNLFCVVCLLSPSSDLRINIERLR